MRPGGAPQAASATSACCSGTFQPSSTPSTASRFSALNSPIEARAQRARAPAALDVQREAGRRGAQLGQADPAVAGLGPQLVRGGVQDARETRLEPFQQLAAEAVARVDHGPAESRRAEQSRLRVAVGLQRAVVVEVVARQVGEHRGVEAHAVDPALVERMRGHLEPERLRAGVARLGEPPVHAHAVGRRQSRVAQRARTAEAERAEVGAAAPEQVGRLREQLGAGGLAVRAGEPDHLEFRGRLPEEAVGDGAGPLGESFDRKHLDLGRERAAARRREPAPRARRPHRAPRPRRRARRRAWCVPGRRGRRRPVPTAGCPSRGPGPRGRDAAATDPSSRSESLARYTGAACSLIGSVSPRFTTGPSPARASSPAVAAGRRAGSRAGAARPTSRRSTPAPRSRRRSTRPADGSSITTTAARRGLLAGTTPPNTAMYLLVE